MGAQTSAHRDGKSQEDASAENLRSAVNSISEGDSVIESKLQQKNGQISVSSLNGKADEQTELNGHSEDNTLAEEDDGVSVSQEEEVPETMDSLQAVVASQVNREKEGNESPDANNITGPEQKEVEEKPGEANEVGFKKIFNFIGFKFTLKKDKNEKTDPVQMLKLMDKEVEGGTKGSEETKEEAATAEGKAAEPETATVEADVAETAAKAATPVDAPSKTVDGETAEKEPLDPAAAATTPRGQETPMSPFRRFFTQGIFSNQHKKASIKRAKEEPKEKAAEEKIKEGEEKAEAGVEEEREKAKEEVKDVEPVTTPETETPEASVEETKEKIQAEFAMETSEAAITDDTKQAEENVEEAVDSDKAPVEITTEADLFSSQKKVKAQGSPLKKLFTGAGLKKLSTKKQKKDKKDTETKLTESGEQAAEQLQSSTESAEVQKPDSGSSSPEESGEHAIGVEATQAEASQEADEEVTSSDEGKKKEGIMPWSSFKKLVTPKKRVKRPSESEDEATVEKAMSTTLFSTESAMFVEKKKEPELTEEEPKAETTEDLEGSTEDPKKMKMDTSLSWEALMCMGGNKKRTRKTSDSEDEETKIEEEAPPTGEEQVKTAESPLGSSGEADQENTVSSPEPSTSPAAGDSTWDTLKRLVTHRKKPKIEEKTDESGGEQVISDSEIPKEESSFSLRKLIPGRRKKKLLSSNLGSGEEDSDIPAVVPLSEYDNEHAESEEAKAEMIVETKDSEEAAPITQVQLSIEERSPSCISAKSVMENLQEIPHDQLSDIPEEGAATPKSADTTIAEDIAEQTTFLLSCQEQEPELSVAELTANSDAENILEQIPEAVTCQEPEMSVSEVTEEMIPATYGETTPLPNEPETESLEVPQEAVELLSDLPRLTSVEIIEIPLEEAASVPEPTPPIEFTETKSKVVLMVHEEIEGSAIYTVLDTKEITKVAVEKLVIPTMECLAEISNGLSTETPVENKADPTEAADANEDPVFKAQVEQVESIFLEPPLEKTIEDILDPNIATEGKEHEDEKVTTINNIKMEVEIVEAPAVNENIVDPIVPTVEDSIAANIVYGSETPVIEVKSKEEMAAVEEIAAVEVNEPAARETVTSLTDANQPTVTEVCEAVIVAPAEEFAIVKETTYLVCPLSESLETQQVEVTEAVAVEKVSVAVAEPAGDDQIQVQVTEVGVTEAEETKEAEAMEETGLVIAQVVIQSAVEKVSEAEFEPKAPASATITTEDALPVQEVATIEKEIELVAEEKSVIAETPVVQVEAPAPETPAEVSATPEALAEAEKPQKEVHEAVQVIETVPVTIEITKSIKEMEDVLKAEVEEIKQEVELKQAMEVNVSVEKVVEVEVVTEVEQTESETDGKAEEEIKEVEGNIEALEVQEVPQSEVEEVVKEFQLEVQQAEVIAVVQEVIAEVPTPETAEEKSEATIVTEETPVPDAPTETAEAPAQPEETTAEVVVPQTTQVVIQATEIIEEAEEEIMVEEVVEKDAIVSSPETKEAPAKEDTTDPEQTPDTPTPEPTPDTPTPAPTVADVVETNMKDDSVAVQEQASDGPQTALEEHQTDVSTEAVAAIQDAPVNSMEEEVALAMAVTVASPAEAAAEKSTSVKCAEVMVQVIEEVVKEIKPVS
ncbi:A-kinase anchor protein 12-like [Salvelinus fontinalis]|uniref:A-kinase anchor protein 12-like n=1 Tax=Salvelinus fontinalis TaxID=8038 RepID=UPI002485394C|nr:A-kinase anchor protein 12-like [Salvelinus fontinalis]XP_055728109.1 A-kinase anchor protein 12-like [Salvelinus fontinalis]